MRRRRIHHELAATAENFSERQADYQGARGSRFVRRRTGLNPMGSGADYHVRSEADHLRLMEYARDMDRNDTLCGAALDRSGQNTLQGGIGFDPDTGDKDVDARLAENWFDWGNDPDLCDIAGENTYHRMTELAYRHWHVDGDILAAGLKAADMKQRLGGPLQMFEAHRIRKPRNSVRNVVLGVLLNQYRRRLEYWVTKEEVDPNRDVVKVGDVEKIQTFDEEGGRIAFHLYSPKRVSQTRGVTALAPIFDVAGLFEDINFTALVKQQASTCVTWIRNRPPNSDAPPPKPMGEETRLALPDGTERIVNGLSPGSEIVGEPGETISGFSPNIPNAEFFNHLHLTMQLFSVNLGLPLILLLMDGSETNFSGWRGAVDQAKFGFRFNQRIMIERWYRPIVNWKIRQWQQTDADFQKMVKAARNKPGFNLFRNKWNPPKWPYVQPLDDIRAAMLALTSNQTSHRRNAADGGDDWDELKAEIPVDRGGFIENCWKEKERLLKACPGIDVTWRDIATFQLAGPAKQDDGKPSEDEPAAKKTPQPAGV